MFIPVDQMKKLREAAKNGDGRAKAILQAQLNGTDYAADLDAYFKPIEEPSHNVSLNKIDGNPGSVTETKATEGTGNARLDAFLADNQVKKGDPDYEDALNDYYNEFPEDMPEDWGKPKPEENPVPEANPEQEAKMEEAAKDLGKMLIDVISECDKEMLEIMQDDSIDDNAKKGAMTSLQEIKQNMLDNIDKIRKIKKSFEKNEEISLQ